MVSKAFTRFLSFASCLIIRQLRTNNSKFSIRKSSNVSQSIRYHNNNITMICNIEDGMLRSSDLFPYFMLVAFEAGSILRALVLLSLYPFICLVGSEEVRLRIMVMVSFFGIRKDGFRLGSSVLPKYFLQDVEMEVFEAMNNKKILKRVGVSKMPRIMVEGFLKDYMGFDCVVGRELKVFHGCFVGLMEEKTTRNLSANLIDGEEINTMIGICSAKSPAANQMVTICDEIYLTNESERGHWKKVTTDKYPKPLVFHDGRLAFKPTPFATLALFTWFPFGIFLALVRSLVGYFLPYFLSKPLLAFSGIKLRVKSNINATQKDRTKGILYVCNHRTLFDPLYLCFILNKELTAVTYSLSRVSEFLSPLKTVRLTRDVNKDSKIMEHMLTQCDLVVCPEGTTCREPYLLRFSPLFTEMSKVIVPVALDSKVSMFYGTTASGLKVLDPFFFIMNPFPSYNVKFLDPVSGLPFSPLASNDVGAKARDSRRFEIANEVQSEIAKTLNYTCTQFTRKDKYMILAGTNGSVST